MTRKNQRTNATRMRSIIMSDQSDRIRSTDDPATRTDKLVGGVFGAVLFGCVYYLCYIAIGVLNQ